MFSPSDQKSHFGGELVKNDPERNVLSCNIIKYLLHDQEKIGGVIVCLEFGITRLLKYQSAVGVFVLGRMEVLFHRVRSTRQRTAESINITICPAGIYCGLLFRILQAVFNKHIQTFSKQHNASSRLIMRPVKCNPMRLRPEPTLECRFLGVITVVFPEHIVSGYKVLQEAKAATNQL